MCIDKFIPITLFAICCQSLVVDYHYDEGIRPFSYQTFSSYSMDYNNGNSYIDFDLQLERDNTQGGPVFIELIVIPDININDIGIKEGGNLHLCCNPELFEKYGCSEKTIGELIIPKSITRLYREQIPMEGALYHFKTNVSVEVTGIHVFALATCDSHLQLASGAETLITFNGTANWVGIKHTNSTINITAYDCIGLFIIILIGIYIFVVICKNKQKKKKRIDKLSYPTP
eukprot:136423_1